MCLPFVSVCSSFSWGALRPLCPQSRQHPPVPSPLTFWAGGSRERRSTSQVPQQRQAELKRPRALASKVILSETGGESATPSPCQGWGHSLSSSSGVRKHRHRTKPKLPPWHAGPPEACLQLALQLQLPDNGTLHSPHPCAFPRMCFCLECASQPLFPWPLLAHLAGFILDSASSRKPSLNVTWPGCPALGSLSLLPHLHHSARHILLKATVHMSGSYTGCLKGSVQPSHPAYRHMPGPQKVSPRWR